MRAQIGESQTGNESETGAGYEIEKVRSNGSDQEGDQDSESTHELN
jgi:hypothetical protein